VFQEQQVPPVDQSALQDLMNQPIDEQIPVGRQSLGLNQINEALEEEISEPTEIQNHNPGGILYPPENSAITNQLEMASMASEHNSVMGHSPIRSSRPTRSR